MIMGPTSATAMNAAMMILPANAFRLAVIMLQRRLSTRRAPTKGFAASGENGGIAGVSGMLSSVALIADAELDDDTCFIVMRPSPGGLEDQARNRAHQQPNS